MPLYQCSVCASYKLPIATIAPSGCKGVTLSDLQNNKNPQWWLEYTWHNLARTMKCIDEINFEIENATHLNEIKLLKRDLDVAVHNCNYLIETINEMEQLIKQS